MGEESDIDYSESLKESTLYKKERKKEKRL